jgi:hypothetical protein
MVSLSSNDAADCIVCAILLLPGSFPLHSLLIQRRMVQELLPLLVLVTSSPGLRKLCVLFLGKQLLGLCCCASSPRSPIPFYPRDTLKSGIVKSILDEGKRHCVNVV